MINLKKILISYTIMLLVLLLVTGCSGIIKKGYPERNYYALDVSRHTEKFSPETVKNLEIRKLNVSSRYDGREFVYRISDVRYKSDFYNGFFKYPSSMITEEVRKWLAESGLFQSVIYSARVVEADYIMEGVLHSLYGDYSESRKPGAIMEIEFFLIKDISAHSEIVFRRMYRKEIPLKDNSPGALVKGWNEALKQILMDFESDLNRKVFSPEKKSH